MAYARRYNHKGPEPLRDNVLRVLQENMAAELALIANETSTTALPVFAEYLKAEKPNFETSVLVVVPDEDDSEETDGGSYLNQAVVFDITFAIKVGNTAQELEETVTGELLTKLMRYKKAVWNILMSVAPSDLFLNLPHTPATIEVRGGAYRRIKAGNTYAVAVRGMKFIAQYGEILNG